MRPIADAAKGEQFARVLDGYRAVYSADPTPALANQLGRALRTEAPQAAELLTLAADTEPHNVPYNLHAGMFLGRLGRAAEAEPYLASAVAAAPDHERAARELERVRARVR